MMNFRMKSWRRVLGIFLAVFTCVGILAGPRSFSQAKVIAEKQAAKLGVQIEENASLGNSAKSCVNGASSQSANYYVFTSGENKGFVIVSGDDRFPEIIGYSDEGSFDATNMPQNLASFMDAYQNMVKAVGNGDIKAVSQLEKVKAMRNSSVSRSVISPILGNVAWGQDAPYNKLCPTDASGKQCVAGCVAVAMAQVMSFYKYPQQLLNDISAYVTKRNKLSIPSINEGETYNWKSIQDNYKGNYTEEQSTAVAKLVYHCGAAVKMDYTSNASAASITPYPLTHYFGYDKDLLQDVQRSSFTQEQWETLINQELNAKRPIIYSGQSTIGGHTFVCDGADGTGLYHINWGWNGDYNGYFDITMLDRFYEGLSSSSSVVYDGFNRECSMLIGIQPDNGKEDEPLAMCVPITVYDRNDCSIDITSSARNNVSGFFEGNVIYPLTNLTYEDFKGYVAIGVKDDKGNVQLISSPKNVTIVSKSSAGYFSIDICKFSFKYAFPKGISVIYALCSEDGMKWDVCGGMADCAITVSATDEELTKISSPLTVQMKLAEDQEGIVATQDAIFDIEITNDLDCEQSGIINVYTHVLNECPDKKTNSFYVVVPAHGKVVRKMKITPSEDLYVWIKDALHDNQMLLDGKHFDVTLGNTPILYLVSATCLNWDENDLETEKSYQEGCGMIACPRVHDDKITVVYGVKNAGVDAVLKTRVACWCPGKLTSGNITYHFQMVNYVGGGEITYVTETFTLDEVGEHFVITDYTVTDGKKWHAFNENLFPVRKYWYVDKKFWFDAEPAQIYAYITGETSFISSVTEDGKLSIVSGAGFMTLQSTVEENLCVYGIGGQCVRSLQLKPNVKQMVDLPSGIYIVKGKKVIVR